MNRKNIVFTLLLSLGTVLPAATLACSVSADGVPFGNYNPFDNVHLDSTGTVSVQCESPYTVELSPSGNNNQFNPRHLANAADDRLIYNLFTDPAHTTIWGDGTDGTGTTGGDGSATGVQHTIYGRIPASQNARVGSYFDTITVTLQF